MVYVIVLNWNGATDTIACAESVLALEGTRLQLVICDNASADDSMVTLSQWALNLPCDNHPGSRLVTRANEPSSWRQEVHPEGSVVLIQTNGNLGYAGGNNVGIRYAMSQPDADYVWILNNDTTVTPRALSALLVKANLDPDYGIIGSTLLYFYRPLHVQVLAGCRFSTWTTQIAPLGEGKLATLASTTSEAEVEAELDYVTGAAMLVSKAFIADVGLMNEDYFLYCEEIDWAERGRRSAKRNWKLGFARESVVLHKVGASAETGVSVAATRFFYTSKIRFMKRFYPTRYPWIFLMILLQGLKKLVNGQSKQAWTIVKALVSFNERAPSRPDAL
jgi:GT2 family glycosyltransferase